MRLTLPVLPKIQCPPPSPNSRFISDTFISGSGSQAAYLEVPLQCSLLSVQCPTGSLFPVFPSQAQLLLPSPVGWSKTIEKKSPISISQVLVAG